MRCAATTAMTGTIWARPSAPRCALIRPPAGPSSSLPDVYDNPEIYDLLVATLRDPDQWVQPSVRTGAIRGIGMLGEPLDAVVPFADDPDWRVRSVVADVLRSTGTALGRAVRAAGRDDLGSGDASS